LIAGPPGLPNPRIDPVISIKSQPTAAKIAAQEINRLQEEWSKEFCLVYEYNPQFFRTSLVQMLLATKHLRYRTIGITSGTIQARSIN